MLGDLIVTIVSLWERNASWLSLGGPSAPASAPPRTSAPQAWARLQACQVQLPTVEGLWDESYSDMGTQRACTIRILRAHNYDLLAAVVIAII